MTSSWMTRQPSPDQPDMDTLYLHKALTADAGGQTYLDVFQPARRVTYLVNHLLGVVKEFRRTEGEELAAFSLDTPTSSSLPLNYRTDDKLLTTAMCAAAGVNHPVTLGFWLSGGYDHEYPKHHPTITVVRLTSRDQDAEYIRSHVQDFLGSSTMGRFEKVVVKPFDPSWYSCKGVTYHDNTDVTGVVRAVLDLVNRIEPGNGILVQSYHPTFDPVVLPDAGRHAVNVEGTSLGFSVRAIVARTPQNGAQMTQVVCGISDGNIPISGVSTVPFSLSLTLQMWGVTDVRQQCSIRHSLRQSCERLMLELLRQEAQLTAEQRGGHGSQTDFLGIDLILTKQKDAIVPVVIDVNTHDCLYHVTVLETMQPRLKGQAVRPLVHIMLARSQRFLMAGKTIVVVGAGGFSKRHIWTEARQLGVKIILVDSNPDHWARREVAEFLHVDMDDHTQDRQHAVTIVTRLTSQLPGVRVDGCLTFWDDFVPLAALVAEGLNLRHAASYGAAMNAKCKARTLSVLRSKGKEPPDHLPPSIYASPVVKVEGVHDVEQAVKKIPLPAVLKLAFGSRAVGTKHVHSLQEAVQHVQHVQDTLRSEQDHPGVGLGHGCSLILMPRLLGSEHDVDVVLFEGQLIAAFVTDNGPTRLPLCSETAAGLPSVLHKEQQHQLVSAAVSCCRQLGLLTGVFNVEMMQTPRGPRLIEVNARMSGMYKRVWLRLIYGVNLVHLALMCACGVRPVLTGGSSLDEEVEDVNRERLMGIMLYPSRHRHALQTTATPERLQRLHDDGHVIFTQFESEVDCSHGSSYEEAYCNLAVKAAGVEEARAKLTGVCTSLGLETEDSLREILQDFVQLE